MNRSTGVLLQCFLLQLGAACLVAGENRWTPLSALSPAEVRSLLVDPERPDTLYVLAPQFDPIEQLAVALLWKSKDRGETWNLLQDRSQGSSNPDRLSRPGLDGVALDPFESRHIWGWNHSDLWFSSDEGESWALLCDAARCGTGAFIDLVPDPQTPGRLFALRAGTAVWQSEDGGTNWQLLSQLADVLGGAGLHIDPQDGETLYLHAQNGLFQSQDGGHSWHLQGAYPGPGDKNGFRDLVVARAAPYSFYAASLAVGPCLLRSDDFGATWQPKSPYPTLECSPALPDPLQPGTVRLAVHRPDGAFLYTSEDGGDTWLDPPQPLPASPFFVPRLFADPRQGESLYLGPIFQSSVDGGRTWKARHQGLLTGGVNSLAVGWSSGPANLFAVIWNNGLPDLRRSPDGGRTWRSLPRSIPDSGVPGRVVTDPQRPGRVFGLANAGVFRSDDAGMNWRWTSPQDLRYPDALYLDPLSPDRVFVGTPDGTVWTSLDAGRTWRQSKRAPWACEEEFCPPANSFAVDARRAHIVYAVAGASLHRSLDGGITWRAIGAELGRVASVVAHPARRKVLFAGGDRGLFRSDDAGEHWRRLARPRAAVLELAIDRRARVLYFVTPSGVFAGHLESGSWRPLALGLPAPLAGPPRRLTVDPQTRGLLYVTLPALGIWTGRFDDPQPMAHADSSRPTAFRP